MESSSINDQGSFAAIHFIAENSVEAVPVTWINPAQNLCSWPTKKGPGFDKLLRDSSSIPGWDWIAHEVRVVKLYGKIFFVILSSPFTLHIGFKFIDSGRNCLTKLTDTYEKARKKAARYVVASEDDLGKVELGVKRKRLPAGPQSKIALPPSHNLVAVTRNDESISSSEVD
jgi:hypothetical protein